MLCYHYVCTYVCIRWLSVQILQTFIIKEKTACIFKQIRWQNVRHHTKYIHGKIYAIPLYIYLDKYVDKYTSYIYIYIYICAVHARRITYLVSRSIVKSVCGIFIPHSQGFCPIYICTVWIPYTRIQVSVSWYDVILQ